MKKNIILLGALVLGSLAYSQVGINIEAPKATLDVTAKTTDGTKPEGIIAPRLTGDQIKAADAQYDTPQIGTIVYATTAVGTSTPKTVNITSPGYYYFDNTLVWVKFGSGTAASTPEPWYIQNTTTPASANTQNIYQNGKVAVGFSNADTVSQKQLEVKGDLKSAYLGTGYFSTIDNNDSTFGTPSNALLVSDNADLGAATKLNAIYANNSTGAALYSYNSGGYSAQNMNFANSNNASSILQIIDNSSNNRSIRLELNSSSGATMYDTAASGSGYRAALSVIRDTGINFNFLNSSGNTEGSYTFPRTNGSSNQVLVTDGSVANAQLSWKDASSLAPEPWRIQGTTNPATTNTQNIYQTGNVSIGSQTPIAPFTSNGTTITPKLSITGDVASTGAFYTNASKYADYVFEDYFDGVSKIDETYKFKSLEETAAYIKENKHLPGVTSIKDILKTENGYTFNLSELSIQQLEKIEELYLHTIEQKNVIDNQKTEIEAMKIRLEKLENLLLKDNNNK